MKFCTKCGYELTDEAVICMGCGCIVGGAATPPRQETAASEKPSDRPSVLPAVFNFIFTIVTTLTLGLLILSISALTVYVSDYGDVYLYPNAVLAVMAWLCSFSSLAFGVVSFVMSLVKRLGAEKILGGIARFVIGIVLSFICFIVILGAA